MSWIIKKLNNPLRTALVFSLFLHVIGLYFLTSLTFITKIRSPETAPIKVRPIIEKRIIKPLKVKSLTQQTLNRPIRALRSVSNISRKDFLSHPTPIHKESKQKILNHSLLRTKLPNQTNQVQLASIKSFSPKITHASGKFRDSISKVEPRMIKNNHSTLRTNNFPLKIHRTLLKPSESYVQKEPKRARASSSFKYGDPKEVSSTHLIRRSKHNDTNFFILEAHAVSSPNIDQQNKYEPVRLHRVKKLGVNKRFVPTVRTVAFDFELTDKRLESSEGNNSGTFAEQDNGELRQGFIRKIWHKVASVKFYPRAARKRDLEGKPVVSFTLGVKGELLKLKLSQSSNYNLLNDAALETVRRGVPYPPIPKPLGQSFISFNLPISYVLEE